MYLFLFLKSWLITLSVTLFYLIDDTLADPYRHYSGSSAVLLPLSNKLRIVEDFLVYENIDNYIETPESWLDEEEHFYFKINDHSHDQNGNLLLIKKQRHINNGDLAAVLISSTIHTRKAYKHNSDTILISEIPSEQPILLSENSNVYLIGKILKTIINH